MKTLHPARKLSREEAAEAFAALKAAVAAMTFAADLPVKNERKKVLALQATHGNLRA